MSSPYINPFLPRYTVADLLALESSEPSLGTIIKNGIAAFLGILPAAVTLGSVHESASSSSSSSSSDSDDSSNSDSGAGGAGGGHNKFEKFTQFPKSVHNTLTVLTAGKPLTGAAAAAAFDAAEDGGFVTAETAEESRDIEATAQAQAHHTTPPVPTSPVTSPVTSPAMRFKTKTTKKETQGRQGNNMQRKRRRKGHQSSAKGTLLGTAAGTAAGKAGSTVGSTVGSAIGSATGSVKALVGVTIEATGEQITVLKAAVFPEWGGLLAALIKAGLTKLVGVGVEVRTLN